MSDKIEEEFNEYQKAQNCKRRHTPTIILLWEDIQTLHKQGNSLKSIYNFLKDRKGLNCCYESFRTIINKLNKEGKQEANTKEQNEIKFKLPEVEKKKQSSDVSFKPVTSIEDGLTPEELQEFAEQQKRMLRRK